MAKLRSGRCYTTVKRAFTRKSRKHELSYVRGVPGTRIAKFEVGATKKEFTHSVHMISKQNMQLRHNALESARLAVNRFVSKAVGKENFHLIIRVYPHHVLRMRKIMSGAGADRLSSGMAHSYGKPVGTAAQVKEGQEIITVRINEAGVQKVKESFKIAGKKLPCKTGYKIITK
jgi:large subunit ribosomal protein L10e